MRMYVQCVHGYACVCMYSVYMGMHAYVCTVCTWVCVHVCRVCTWVCVHVCIVRTCVYMHIQCVHGYACTYVQCVHWYACMYVSHVLRGNIKVTYKGTYRHVYIYPMKYH